ncbi:hypothetical protein LCGC14_0381570 [marine sediment metagenome]|uniref:7-cyano-7-deazaguanine synthase n=1 Tax=marine sediment metagenome TaxID=412755 RepID=A0A0F9T1X2_9ZZZZ
MTKALVLLSGGMDSATCLALAKSENETVRGLSLSYGQKHVREVDYAIELAKHFNCGVEVLELPKIFQGASSSLVDDGVEMPQMSYEELAEAKGPSKTYVPQRNMNFLAVASSIALIDGADYIYFGAHADDAHNWAYPDCTPEFIGAMANAIYVGSYFKTRLRTPFMWFSKADIAALGDLLKVPFEKTWSCYEGGELHCGTCPTCVSRIEAFGIAGVVDPTQYESVAI